MSMSGPLPADVKMLERGWLSSNSTLLQGDPRGAVLIDSGYCTHKQQTLALVQEALADPPSSLRLIINTHLHSDHCGGNAHLSAAYGCPIWVPPGHYTAAVNWDPSVLSYEQTGQQCERFTPAQRLQPGSTLEQGGRTWQILAAPGHDPHSLILFEPEAGILISADALWEHGFGIVFPEIEGDGGFDEVEATLALITSLQVRMVIPGHGRLFTNVDAALNEARQRLAFFRNNPARHARHAAKALIKYHLLEVQQQSLKDLIAWLEQTPIHRQIWANFFKSQPMTQWSMELLSELQKSGVIRQESGQIYNH